MSDPSVYFDSIAEEYRRSYSTSDRPRMLATVHILRKRLIRHLTPQHISAALEIGGGPGAYADFLLRRALAATCLDISHEMLAAARRAHSDAVQNGRLRLVQGSVTNMPFDSEAFDFIVGAGVVEYVQNDGVALAEIARVLAPNGTAIITFPLRHPVTSLVLTARSRALGKLRRALRRQPITHIAFPYHHNYGLDELRCKLGRARLRIIDVYMSHFFVRLPARFPGASTLLEIDHQVALRSRHVSRLAARLAETAVFVLRRQ